MSQRQLKRLEEQGVLVSRRIGNLRSCLEDELEALPQTAQQQFFRQRKRPRQSAKPLVMHD